jgi:hypothetical protein
MEMWKIAVGFVVFAGLALYLLSKGGDIDMGGEKHGNLRVPVQVSSALPALSGAGLALARSDNRPC